MALYALVDPFIVRRNVMTKFILSVNLCLIKATFFFSTFAVMSNGFLARRNPDYLRDILRDADDKSQ